MAASRQRKRKAPARGWRFSCESRVSLGSSCAASGSRCRPGRGRTAKAWRAPALMPLAVQGRHNRRNCRLRMSPRDLRDRSMPSSARQRQSHLTVTPRNFCALPRAPTHSTGYSAEPRTPQRVNSNHNATRASSNQPSFEVGAAVERLPVALCRRRSGRILRMRPP